MDITAAYYKKRIIEFLKVMEEFCKERKIENSLRSFVDYGWNGFYSPAYDYLLKYAPKIYLVNSKIIMEDYYQKLDKDFQEDLIPSDYLKEYEYDLKKNSCIHEFIKTTMGEDSRII